MALTSRGLRRRSADSAPRIGVFGLLGSGNLGNDGSLAALLAFLRLEHPNAVVSCRCPGPEQVMTRYGVPATPLYWYGSENRTASTPMRIAGKLAGKVVDAFRTLSWVRRQDVVIVPGMGVLEATLPLRPWGWPYALFLLCASGRLAGTKVALVSVGANVVHNRATRWMITGAAGLAHYRSYRDSLSRDAMRAMGLDVGNDRVYPDLAFALPPPPATQTTPGAVGVGLMAYYGGDDDRRQAGELHRAYVDSMKRFARWLVDDGRRVRLIVGDAVDQTVVAEILADLRAHRPGLDPGQVIAEPASTLDDLMRQLSTVETVVATRYHNVLCALKLCKPTLSIGYAAKNDVLMTEMGLDEFSHPARSIDLERLIEQFRTLEGRREQIVDTIAERNRGKARDLEQQFAGLSTAVLDAAVPNVHPARTSAGEGTS